jgi:threonine/homoserine/homoserine lactone efflux protein
MIDLSTLALFVAAVLTLFVSPGPNMAFVLSQGAAFGMRGGFAAALGIAAADVVLTILTATGVTAIVAAWPPSFDVLRYLGAAYLLWLAAKALRRPHDMVVAKGSQMSIRKVFGAALVNCLLNPKALLFFMVFLPQFVDAQRGSIPLQIVLLGLVLSALGLVFHTLLGLFSGRVNQLLKGDSRAALAQRWVLGGVLAALALRLLLLERPAHS